MAHVSVIVLFKSGYAGFVSLPARSVRWRSRITPRNHFCMFFFFGYDCPTCRVEFYRFVVLAIWVQLVVSPAAPLITARLWAQLDLLALPALH